MKQLFGESSFGRLIAAFCGKKKLNEKQAKQVRKLMKELENDMEDE